MTAKQKALDAISSLPDDTEPQDIVKFLVHLYRIQQGLTEHGGRLRVAQTGAEQATALSARAAQVEAWRRLAGQWQSEHSAEKEIEAIYAARTSGREVDL